jgi:tRNA modification GTPase
VGRRPGTPGVYNIMIRFREGDTIIAPATAPGRGALAIIRVSGSGTRDLLGRILAGGLPGVRKAVLDRIIIGEEVIDEVVVVFYSGPRSYTGEDAAEITCHGGPAVVARIIEAAVELGARPAEPGEFTWRALLSGKMDLVQAQAVADITAAETELARRDASARMAGHLSRKFEEIRSAVLEAATAVEADIDFEIECDKPSVKRILSKVAILSRELAGTAVPRRLIREGIAVAIMGPPNAGKSTLFNRLLGEDRAIVTAVPGTTTDRVEAVALFNGVPFRLNDSCGLTHEPSNEIEAEGDRRSREFAARTDVILWVVDSTLGNGGEPPKGIGGPETKVFTVYNKIDLSGTTVPAGALAVSALTGENVGSLVKKLSNVLPDVDSLSSVSLAERERSSLLKAAAHADAAKLHLESGGFLDLAAEEIREASSAVGALLGDITPDEVLSEIFSNFCVGK